MFSLIFPLLVPALIEYREDRIQKIKGVSIFIISKNRKLEFYYFKSIISTSAMLKGRNSKKEDKQP